MNYGSVCSGIEAASVAWEPLGWKPAWFAEVEPFPSAVLAHHWPDVANLGDMTRLARRVMLGEIKAPDVLVGGTPCQAFSVAGMREGMADERGQLTMKYVELANAIDTVRVRAGNPETVIVWENVPGVLSDKSNAFGCFLGALAGEDRELQPSGKKWTNAGCVYGPQRAIAWRVLDAQYFGVAQRRRRVFVVASAREDIDPAEILFEREGVRRDTAPRREARKDAAGHTAVRIDCTGKGIAGTVSSKWAKGTGGPAGDEHYNLAVVESATVDIAHALNTANNGKGCSEDGTGRGVPTIAFKPGQSEAAGGIFCTTDYSPTLQAANNGSTAVPAVTVALRGREGGTGRGVPTIAFQPGNLRRGAGSPPSGEVFPTLKSDHGRGWSDQSPHVATIAFSSKDYGGDAMPDLSPTIRAGGHNESHANASVGPAVCFVQNSRSEVRQVDGDGQITGAIAAAPGAQQQHYLAHVPVSPTVRAGGNAAGGDRPMGTDVDTSDSLLTSGLAVRRLTPVECERLQGFPDNHTQVPYRNKPAADGPRYKAIGNSMAVPVMQWIGRRIDMATGGEA